jgi:hypothetical protein
MMLTSRSTTIERNSAADIQALRALAVGLVVAYHALQTVYGKVDSIHGGFFGVVRASSPISRIRHHRGPAPGRTCENALTRRSPTVDGRRIRRIPPWRPLLF